ncbi:matrixin family metalloprotease [Streptomyces sp. NPDC087440]|uniref:matrixin family metalloprotease n=1 Tax=Streptomyces sp. NPDC087440 TaxID=3365790 RepID=UPI003808B339
MTPARHPLATLLTATALAVALANPAHALPQRAGAAAAPARCTDGVDSRGDSSVDGREIAWEDSTAYDDARRHAVRAWTERARGLDRVRFRPDDSFSYADLEWTDTDRTDGKWHNTGAAWSGRPGTDVVFMNDAYLADGRRYGATRWRRIVAAHELGHALGFCHKSQDWYFTLMERGVTDLPADGRPTRQDVTNYRRLWG